MAQLTLNLGLRELKELVFQLPPEEMIDLAKGLSEKTETFEMMRLGETGFSEWKREEDIYGEG